MKTLFLGALALAAAVTVPGAAFAATYAYVNFAGEVLTTEATSAEQAIMTAPGIATHSGVMTVTADDANVIGDKVSGT